MSATQLALPGLETFFEPSYQWQPKPHVLERVKSYFLGYEANGRTIRAGRRHIADKLGLSIRTLSRYIAVLVGQNWITTIRRTTRAAIRKVLSVLGVPDSGTPLGTRIEVIPQVPERLLRKTDPPLPLVLFLKQKRRYARKKEEEQDEPEGSFELERTMGHLAYIKMQIGEESWSYDLRNPSRKRATAAH